MAVKDRATLKAENAEDFKDNTARFISPAKLRGQMDDVVDSAVFPEDGIVGIPGPPGADSGSVDGIAALRALPPVNGQTVRLNYHTTVGDLGAGLFRGVTTGSYTDDNGVTIVPGGATGSTAWLRIWDQVVAHVGWFGAKCDRVRDDYAEVKKCLELYSNGRTATRTGKIDVGPGFAFGQPLIWGDDDTGTGFRWRGLSSRAKGAEQVTTLKYTGPATDAAIIFYGGAEAGMEDINLTPGLAYNGVALISDNTFKNGSLVPKLTVAVTAGANVTATLDTVNFLQIGAWLGVDDGANFEIVRVKALPGGSTLVADFTKNHAINARMGGGAPLFSGRFDRCRLLTSDSAIWTTVSSSSGFPTTVYTPASMTGIEVGMPLRIGSFGTAETVLVSAIDTGAGTFTATSGQSHAAGDIIMYPTAGLLMGNRITVTVQVSEIVFHSTNFSGNTANRGYAGIRQISGGNTKEVHVYDGLAQVLQVPFAFESANGAYSFSGVTTAAIYDTVYLLNGGTTTIVGHEDESAAYWIRASSGGAAITTSCISCAFQGQAPADNGEVVIHSGQLTFMNCNMLQGRVTGLNYPVIVSLNVNLSPKPASLAMINCYIYNVTATTAFVRDVPASAGGGTDMLANSNAPITVLSCKGGPPGALINLPTRTPQLQNTATGINPLSMATLTIDPTVRTMTVTGAALGDLVEASFSLDMQGGVLSAWVSASDTVTYQFSNPTGSTIDLLSGTVKCRVKK